MWKRQDSEPNPAALEAFFSEDIDNLFTSAIALVCKQGNAVMIGTNRKNDAVMMKFYEDGEDPQTIWCNDPTSFRDALIELHAYNSLQQDPK